MKPSKELEKPAGKRPVKLMQLVKTARSFIFTVCVKSVPLYRFKLA